MVDLPDPVDPIVLRIGHVNKEKVLRCTHIGLNICDLAQIEVVLSELTCFQVIEQDFTA